MNSSLRKNIALFIVLLLGPNFHVVSSNLSSVGKNTKALSPDFINFLEHLGSSVYSYRGRRKFETQLSDDTSMYSDYEINKKHDVRKVSPTLITQKAALRDVLMMKLVSYYEDKYKLTGSPTTAEPRVLNISTASNVKPIPTKHQINFTTLSMYTHVTLKQDPYIANNEEIIII